MVDEKGRLIGEDRERERERERERGERDRDREREKPNARKNLREGAAKGLLGAGAIGGFLEMLEGLSI